MFHALHAFALLARLMSLEPVEATWTAATVAGWPGFARELVSICKRESPGHDCKRRVGVHGNDPDWAVERFYRKAKARGWIAPERCPQHRRAPIEFAVRGMHGLAAAYSLRFLGECVAPEALDNPYLSAYTATKRAQAMCLKHKACSRSERHSLWRGKARPVSHHITVPLHSDSVSGTK